MFNDIDENIQCKKGMLLILIYDDDLYIFRFTM